MKAYIKDLQSGNVREYGSNQHDSLMISQDGRSLHYYNLQCGEGSRYGDFRFCDKNGVVPAEDIFQIFDAYFNIGGWPVRSGEWIPRMVCHKETSEVRQAIECSECHIPFFRYDESENTVEYIPQYCPNCGAKMKPPEEVKE